MSHQYIGAIDQGTTSTRFIIFDQRGRSISSSYREHEQIYPASGWVEHDPEEIWKNTCKVIEDSMNTCDISPGEIHGIGVTNQRETIVFWDETTGTPLHNAIVWQDTRTEDLVQKLKDQDTNQKIRQKTGLPLASYFSATKIKWVLEQNQKFRNKVQSGDVKVGTIDSWIIWKLTGGHKGGSHITDVTNASRTLLMNIHDLEWDQDLLEFFDVPQQILPDIRPSSDSSYYGVLDADLSLDGTPVCGALGDQQAALVGQTCFSEGKGKCTYGTGNFLLVNCGNQPEFSEQGLLSTIAYQFDNQDPKYALEGSIAITGALVQWLRDNLQFFEESDDIEKLAAGVEDNGGVYFVPAFSGLYAPYWDPEAQGLITGLTRDNTKGHIARAALESTAFQTCDVMKAMEKDASIRFQELRVDGGMVKNELLMQFQSDILGIPVIRSKISETTALGAAFAAGLATGAYRLKKLPDMWKYDQQWRPQMGPDMNQQRAKMLYNKWKKAVNRCMYSPDNDM